MGHHEAEDKLKRKASICSESLLSLLAGVEGLFSRLTEQAKVNSNQNACGDHKYRLEKKQTGTCILEMRAILSGHYVYLSLLIIIIIISAEETLCLQPEVKKKKV